MRYPVQIKGSDQYIASLVIFMYVVEVFWESPKNQKSKHLSWAWVELAMVGETHVEVLIIWCDYFVGRRSRERVLSMESPYRGTDSVNERTYSPWAWSVSTQIDLISHCLKRTYTSTHKFFINLKGLQWFTNWMFYGWTSIFSLTIESHRKAIKLQVSG